jgi:hypothetical protein
MVQPWARETPVKPKRIDIGLSYTFRVEHRPSGDFFLAIERPETFAVSLNGRSIDVDTDCGWWVDRSLRRVRLDPGLLRPGRNEIILTCDYAETHPGLETIYLLGDFGTQVEGTRVKLTAPPSRLAIGDWVTQGLAFYSGSVGYMTRIEPQTEDGQRVFVRVPSYLGAAVRVLLDGTPAGVIAWEPNEVEITDLIGEGPAELCIQVLGHRRNSHGPLHLVDPHPRWVGPNEFVTEGEEWLDGYHLKPCGLMASPELLVRRRE